MSLRERIGALLDALGQIGPFDEYWDVADPRLEHSAHDRLAHSAHDPLAPSEPYAGDEGRRSPAA